MPPSIVVPAIELQTTPRIILAAIPGAWLVRHSTPSWRIKDPIRGFQRMVKEARAREIAVAVLDQHRTFPNSVILATDRSTFSFSNEGLTLPNSVKFLVVDGQHRLWAQHFSHYKATYGCVIHSGLTEVAMAQLFLEINDTQKRVPSSLRWDLVRLVRPLDDPHAIEAAELVFELTTDEQSPLYLRIDRTGEQGEIDLKQGSIAPEIKSLVSSKKPFMKGHSYSDHYEALTRFFSAIREVDARGWRQGTSPLAKARVIRAMIRLIPGIAQKLKLAPHKIPRAEYVKLFRKIDQNSLSTEAIRAVQGSAGIASIASQIRAQLGIK